MTSLFLNDVLFFLGAWYLLAIFQMNSCKLSTYGLSTEIIDWSGRSSLSKETLLSQAECVGPFHSLGMMQSLLLLTKARVENVRVITSPRKDGNR